MKYIVFFLSGLFFILFATKPSPRSNEASIPVAEEFTDTHELSFLFIGDIMQHEPQISSAWDNKTKTYSFDHCFQYVKDVYEIADVTVANLEFTFGGKPYRGYPQFSAPDEVGHAIKNAGIDVLVLANNHTCDRGKKGIIRTIYVVDSLEILRTGSFLDAEDRERNNPLIIERNGIRIALLNYSYGFNGLPVPSPTIVNEIDTALIRKDIKHAKSFDPDEIIVYYHWGNEYERVQNKQQVALAELCFNNGARIVIGSHPHVLQPMHRYKHLDNPEVEVAAVYSLGNYISNQRQRYCDGGAMLYLKLRKYDDILEIAQMGYILTWVWTPYINGQKKYYIIPVSKYEHIADFFDPYSFTLFKKFRDDSREHLQKHNINVNEMIWDTISHSWVIQN